MENRKDIGKAFKNKLTHLDKSPSDDLWSSIEKKLDTKKKKKTLFWFFTSFLTLILLTSFLFFEQTQEEKSVSKNQEKPVTSTQAKKPKTINKKNGATIIKKNTNPTNKKSSTKINIGKPIINTETNKNIIRTEQYMGETKKTITYNDKYEEYEVVKKYKIIIKKNKIITKINNNLKIKATDKTGKPTHQGQIKKRNNLKSKITIKKNKINVIPTKTLNTKQNKIETENIPVLTKSDTINSNKPEVKTPLNLIKKDAIKPPFSQKEKKIKRTYRENNTDYEEKINPEFSVSVFYGPSIFGSLSGESMLNPSFTNLSKNHPISSFYGFYFKSMYNRIGFRVGISKINLQTSTRLNKNQLITNYTNIELNSDQTPSTINETFNDSNKIDLTQQISYYELPIEFNYSIKKNESNFNMDVFSGFSLMILDKNILYLSSEKVDNLNIGYAKNISNVNISYNLGIGMNYKLTDEFQLDFNPIFKYYLSSFKEKNNSKPYSFSIQTGITYKF